MIYLEILIVLTLIVLNGFFAMSELAVVSARKSRLKALVAGGSSRARAALQLAEQPGTFLPTVQIGITLIGVLAGAFSGATIAEKLSDWLDRFASFRPMSDGLAIALVVAAITYLSLIIGELVPKQLALRNPEAIATRVARPLRLIARATSPAVWLLRVSSDVVLRLLGVRGEATTAVTEEEIRTLIAEGTQAGVFEESEREIVERALRLDDRSVQTVMTPRHDVVWLDVADTAEEVARKIRESGRSRFPLCNGTPDDVVGIVQVRDLLPLCLAGAPFDLHAVVRPAPVLHEHATALEALELIRRSPVHMGIVVDEYGTLQGVATIIDIIEAMVGTIRESDRPEEPEATRRDDGSWLVDGLMPIPEVKQVIGMAGIPENEGFHTLAGFIMWELGRLPKVGDAFDWNGWRVEVADMDGRRIDKVSLRPPAAAPMPES
ncbi:MAG TPA: hemolysin family protein [Alphaproteobacteria bacterium]